MYSVIIQNQKTMESFQEHHPLFMEALDERRIGYCRWMESGTSIDTAVPELRDLTNGKEEWRAVIIRMIDDEGMQGYESNAYNPYDFVVNMKNASGQEELESQIPIIRLTHMLGGIPAPAIEFEKHTDIQDGKLPHTYYSVKYDSEIQEKYRSLQKKYEFDGRLPAEIWLITMRRAVKNDLVKQTKHAWENPTELDSSEFWRRNRYPAMCRFMVYDYEQLGTVQRTADVFNFWMTVLLLSTNYIEPSALQGYRLYHIHTTFNKEAMQWSFQTNANKIVGIRRDITERSLRAREANRKHDRRLTFLDVKIDPLKLQTKVGNGVNPAVFRTYAKTEREEMSNWRKMSSEALGEIHQLVKDTERGLNERAEEMRENNRVSRESVRRLNRFEMEDLEARLSKCYNEILQRQKSLPDTTIAETEEEKKQSAEISAFIKTRVSNTRAVSIASQIDLLIMVLAMPIIVKYFSEVKTFPDDAFIKGLGSIAVPLFFMLAIMISMQIAFLWNRHVLRKKIKKYNALLNGRLRTIKENEQEYTDFVNYIVSYARGMHYIRILKEKEEEEDSIITIFEKHLKATDVYTDRLERWGEAHFLNFSFKDESEMSVVIDAMIPPIHNQAYTFETGGEYEIPLNETGENIISPFGFVERLTICREELFDDAKNID